MEVHLKVHSSLIHKSTLSKRQETCQTKILSTRELSCVRTAKCSPMDMKMTTYMYTTLLLNHGVRDENPEKIIFH